ncbi:Hsp70 family protein [Glycomyces buryatensis]|uniref:Hsp70 family protein n=1 Tax=Glycomyces buryatensis TaxID=2570927 RepID=A0A4S8QCK0_9ACTN|nr:Hsp70 family protein [Glycomyces buryatensis]THV42257.1 Hsp70 family protein [Glycomyces buryatensis]
METPAPQHGLLLGIDFGTSHTVAVVRRPDGRSDTLLFDGSPLLPSAVYAQEDGTIAVGRDAVHSGRRRPDRFEPNPKRAVDTEAMLLGDREYEVVELIAAVLRRVGAECARVAGVPEHTTVTVPASWGPLRNKVIHDAAERAGIAPVALVPEPVAAATFYTSLLEPSVASDSSVVVFDFGAGTFDVTAVARRAAGFEVLAVDGRDDLGGLDMDAAILEHLGRQFASDPNWRRLLEAANEADREARRELLEEIRFAKERLSRHQSIDLPVPGHDADMHLTRSELEEATAPLIRRAVSVIKAVIQAAGLTPDRIAGMFLVGGGSRMPIVATVLHQELGIAPTTIEQPETAVAQGSVFTSWARPAPPQPAPASPVTPANTPTPRPLPQHQAGLPKPPRAAAPIPRRRRLRNVVFAAAASVVLIAAAVVVVVNWDRLLNFGNGDAGEDSSGTFVQAAFHEDTCADFDYGPYLELAEVDVTDFSSEDVTGNINNGYLSCFYFVDNWDSLQFSVKEWDNTEDAAHSIESSVEEGDGGSGGSVSEFTELGDAGYHQLEEGPPTIHSIAFREGTVAFHVAIWVDSDGPEPEAVDAVLIEIGHALLETFIESD